MKVLNSTQRAKLFGTCSRLYLSKAGEDTAVYAVPEPSNSGDGAWCSVRFFVRYDDAGISSVEDIARRFVADFVEQIQDQEPINGGDAVDYLVGMHAEMVAALGDDK